MTAEILKNLLALQAAVQADDGDRVISTLTEMLQRHASFETGELVLSLAADLHRRKLTPVGENLVLSDVLDRLASHAIALRIDDRDDARHLPDTKALLEAHGWRSLLAIPMASSVGVRGAVVLVARPACAFAGAPLGALGSLVTSAGLSLHHALKLSGQHDEVESLRFTVREERAAMAARVDAEAPLVGERQALNAEVSELRHELTRSEEQSRHTGEALSQAEQRCQELEAQRDGWEKRALAAEEHLRQIEGQPGTIDDPSRSGSSAAAEPTELAVAGSGSLRDGPDASLADPPSPETPPERAASAPDGQEPGDASVPTSDPSGTQRARRRSRRRRR